MSKKKNTKSDIIFTVCVIAFVVMLLLFLAALVYYTYNFGSFVSLPK